MSCTELQNGQRGSAGSTSQSYLFIQQLLVFSAVTKQDVGQFSPHAFVLEVMDLREAERSRRRRETAYLH